MEDSTSGTAFNFHNFEVIRSFVPPKTMDMFDLLAQIMLVLSSQWQFSTHHRINGNGFNDCRFGLLHKIIGTHYTQNCASTKTICIL